LESAGKNNSNKGLNIKVRGYHFCRELLERDDIDAVAIDTRGHWHAPMVVDAVKAGKDIYCEKPLALTVAEECTMVNTTRKYDRVFQTSNMQRS